MRLITRPFTDRQAVSSINTYVNKQISETEAFPTRVQEVDMDRVSIKSTTNPNLFAHVEDSRGIFRVSVDSEILVLSQITVTPTFDDGAPINMSRKYRKPWTFLQLFNSNNIS